MSFYRTILAVVAAVAIASPVFADDTTTTSTTTGTDNTAMQTTEGNGAATTATTTTTTTTTEGKINLNTASAKELMKVKGLNASKARAIVAYRKKHGSFTTTNDLANVKGFKKMNPTTMKDIADQLTVE